MSDEKVVELCRNLIMQKSPSGSEEGVVGVMRDFSTRNSDFSFHTDKYGNCYMSLEGTKPGKTLLFDAHMDTVDADPSHWKHDPWGGIVEEGKIYGRGTSDMKGALAAMLTGLEDFHSKNQRNFPGRIVVAGIVYEELFEGIAAEEMCRNIRPDFVVIGESSQLNLKIGQRGRAEIVLEVFGKNAHSSNPEKGINAVYNLCEFIPKIRCLPNKTHPSLGKGILELIDIKSHPYPGSSVVPNYCKATFDRRLLPGETPEEVLGELTSLLEEHSKTDPSFKGSFSFAKETLTCYTGEDIGGKRFFPAWIFEESELFIQRAEKALKDVGQNPELTNYSFCTNGSHYAGKAGIPTIGYGPSCEELAHTTDEYVEIDQLLKAEKGYSALMEALLFA